MELIATYTKLNLRAYNYSSVLVIKAVHSTEIEILADPVFF